SFVNDDNSFGNDGKKLRDESAEPRLILAARKRTRARRSAAAEKAARTRAKTQVTLMTIATVSVVNREALSRPLNARRRNGVWHACCLIFLRRCAYPLSRRLSGCFLLCGKGELAAPRGVQRV